jgi:AcrR family transcriptional regulator
MYRRPPGPTPRFTRDDVARRALAVMDAHGTEALTMRKLASQLGMGTMTLYRYFPGKRQLVDAAIETAAPEIKLPEPGAAPWKEQLAALARALYDAGRRHPSLARERFERPLQTPAAMRITDRTIALLLDAGLAKPAAVAAFKALLLHALGAAALAAAETQPEIRRAASRARTAVPAPDLPAMATVADELTTALGGDQAFEFALHALLDAIEQHTSVKS